MNLSVREANLHSYLDTKKIFIFDFDGVLVDSVEIKTNAFYELYIEYGSDVAEKVILHHRANGGMSRYDKFRFYHKQYLDKSISDEELDKLDEEFSLLVIDNVVKANEILGASKLLERVCVKRKCFICSATPEVEIQKIIKLRGWSNYFISVLGSPTSKSNNLNEIIKKSKLNSIDAVFFGDAMADYEAAKDNLIDFIGVGELWENSDYADSITGNIIDFNRVEI